MHSRELGVGPCTVPTLQEEDEQAFEWDRDMPLSERARRALGFLEEAMVRFGNLGQPI